jgi:hypothetical protein
MSLEVLAINQATTLTCIQRPLANGRKLLATLATVAFFLSGPLFGENAKGSFPFFKKIS